MDLLSLLLVACALSMDAFAVSLCKGFSTSRLNLQHYLKVGIYFGAFQALMPLLGFYIGQSFSSFVDKIDHYIAFILLSLIGLKMIKESRQKKDECDDSCADFSHKTMSFLALATSIDALAIGVSIAFLDENIFFEEMVSLNYEIQKIEDEIQASINSKAFKLGKMLTCKNKRLDLSSVLPPERKKN